MIYDVWVDRIARFIACNVRSIISDQQKHGTASHSFSWSGWVVPTPTPTASTPSTIFYMSPTLRLLLTGLLLWGAEHCPDRRPPLRFRPPARRNHCPPAGLAPRPSYRGIRPHPFNVLRINKTLWLGIEGTWEVCVKFGTRHGACSGDRALGLSPGFISPPPKKKV